LPKDNPPLHRLSVAEASSALRGGEVVAYPTEAVWGLGCDPFSESAVIKLLGLKGRPVDKGLILVAANVAQIERYLDANLPAEKNALLETLSEQPVTWLVPVNRELVPAWITGSYPNLAVRISHHPLVQALCLAFGGPIVSTSANPAGLPPAKTAAEVRRYFGNQIPLCAGETGNAARPSTIRDLLTGEVLRE
jgi:L-threonylcarbamoyladenylate synthase